MAFSGLPRQRKARLANTRAQKSYLYYARRREQHRANGPTLPLYAANTNISAALLRGKWNRYCCDAMLDPDELLKSLTAADVKAWFDWIKTNFKGSIKADGTLANYWRTLKRLYYLKNGKEMDSDMRRDCINYRNQVSQEMGLRKLPLPKPTADTIDLLKFQVTHLVHCKSVFADEKQRLYVIVGLNLSSISGCRSVSLFDTRHTVNLRPDGTFEPSAEEMATGDHLDLSTAEDLSDDSLRDSGFETGTSGEMEAKSYDGFESDLDYDGGYTSDSSTVTDDGYLAGNEETRTILWRHVEFYVVRNPIPKHRHLLTAIYTVPIPGHREGIQLKIKGKKLDLPIFREPELTDKGYRTSDETPLKARTWARYLKRIGKKAGQKENLTQKEIRRGVINAINNQAPASVRDQIADHESNAVKYYLNEKVDFDTAAAFHRRASNEVVQREMRTATLMADNTAPICLTDEQSRKLSNHPEIRRLRKTCQQLTFQIHQLGMTVKKAQDKGLDIGTQKKEADANLNRTLTRLRKEALEKNRKRHFRDTDTAIFNRQYEDKLRDQENEQENSLPTLNHYFIPEREEIVRLLCYSPAPQTDDKAHLRRLDFIRLMVRWQRRKENPRRGKQDSAMVSQPEWETTTWKPVPASITEKYDPLQCPFCLSDRSLPPTDREKRKSKRNKLWDHVENMHKLELAAFDSSVKPCGLCGMRNVHFAPPSVMHFKNHTQKVHGIRLRA